MQRALWIGLGLLAATLASWILLPLQPKPFPASETEKRITSVRAALNEYVGRLEGDRGDLPKGIVSELAASWAGQNAKENIGSEWIWKTLGARHGLKALPTSDTDEDGRKEFCDEWGHPLVFIPRSWRGEEFVYVRGDRTRVRVGRMGYLKGPYELFSLGRDGDPLTYDEVW